MACCTIITFYSNLTSTYINCISNRYFFVFSFFICNFAFFIKNDCSIDNCIVWCNLTTSVCIGRRIYNNHRICQLLSNNFGSTCVIFTSSLYSVCFTISCSINIIFICNSNSRKNIVVFYISFGLFPVILYSEVICCKSFLNFLSFSIFCNNC